MSFSLIVSAAPVAPPRPPAPATFTVLDFGPPGLPRGLATQLEAAAAAGLSAAGATVIAASPTPAAPQGATTLLRGTCEIEGSTYRLHLEFADAGSNSVLVSRDDVCEICTEKDVAETANIAASALKAALDRASRAPLAVAAPAPRPAVALDAPEHNQDRGAHGFLRRALPWAAIGAGTYAIGTGIYFLSFTGDKDCYNDVSPTVCHRHYDTTLQGAAWIGAGAALAATGAIYLGVSAARARRKDAERPVAETDAGPPVGGISLSPAGVTAWGTF